MNFTASSNDEGKLFPGGRIKSWCNFNKSERLLLLTPGCSVNQLKWWHSVGNCVVKPNTSQIV
mgnify:CR=1 FL=1